MICFQWFKFQQHFSPPDSLLLSFFLLPLHPPPPSSFDSIIVQWSSFDSFGLCTVLHMVVNLSFSEKHDQKRVLFTFVQVSIDYIKCECIFIPDFWNTTLPLLLFSFGDLGQFPRPWCSWFGKFGGQACSSSWSLDVCASFAEASVKKWILEDDIQPWIFQPGCQVLTPSFALGPFWLGVFQMVKTADFAFEDLLGSMRKGDFHLKITYLNLYKQFYVQNQKCLYYSSWMRSEEQDFKKILYCFFMGKKSSPPGSVSIW